MKLEAIENIVPTCASVNIEVKATDNEDHHAFMLMISNLSLIAHSVQMCIIFFTVSYNESNF